MQNNMDVLPIDIAKPQVQPQKRAQSTHEGHGFSEAIDSATERANTQQPEDSHTTNKPQTKDETKPLESAKPEPCEKEDMDMDSEDLADNGYIDIQQTVAGLIINLAKENKPMDSNLLEAEKEQPEIKLPEQEIKVDVLEGFHGEDREMPETAPVQDSESGDAMQFETELKAEAEAWMPTEQSEAAPQQPAQPVAQAPSVDAVDTVGIAREVESRLEEHLRPLENDNLNEADSRIPAVETVAVTETAEDTPVVETPDVELPIEITDTKEIEIDVEETKDDEKSIEDIHGGEIAGLQSAAQAETSGSPTDGTGDDKDSKDAETEDIADKPRTESPQNEAFAVKQDAQAAKPVDYRQQKAEETVFNKMVENIAANAKEGKQRFSINLRPDFMGDMNIELVMGETGLTARIKTSDPQVNSLISQHLFKLEESLKAQGIDVAALEVSVFDAGDFGKEDFSRQHSGEGSDSESRTRAGRIGRIKAVSNEAIAAAGMVTLSASQTVEALGMGSSVEYSA